MFRLWNIYLPKLVLATIAGVVISDLVFDSGLLNRIPPHVLLLGILGGVLFCWWTLRGIRCPLCGTRGKMAVVRKNQPAVICPSCGIVYAKHSLWSFEILAEPPDSNAEAASLTRED